MFQCISQACTLDGHCACLLAANRKRHTSTDEPNNLDTSCFNHSFSSSAGSSSSSGGGGGAGGGSKKARVFFTEDQKDLLRSAYNKDPYPSQGRIEELANELGVGTKTIVNWFHNHRMRAKQVHGAMPPASSAAGSLLTSQSHSSSHLSPFGTAAKTSGERWEESSNMSEHSSSAGSESGGGGGVHLKSNTPFRGGAGGGGSPDPSSGAQWLFPRFEPLAFAGARRGSEGFPPIEIAPKNLRLLDEAENEAEDLSVSKSRDFREENRNSDEATELDQSKYNNNSSSIDTTNSSCDVSGGVKLVGDNSSSKSRRKSSKPQWVFEGTQLERSRANGTVSPASGCELQDNLDDSLENLAAQTAKNNNLGETSDGDGSSGDQPLASEHSDDATQSSSSKKKRKLDSDVGQQLDAIKKCERRETAMTS